jgi:hypothetical protein
MVQPAQFADRLNALLDEARGFGRRTIEQKVACGRKLLEAKAEWEKQAEEGAKPGPWKVVLKRFGFPERMARRLMTAARSHESVKMTLQLLKSQPFDATDIYDDGFAPEDGNEKKPCRNCRINGKPFNPKCPGCRALNRNAPKPKEDDGPLTDFDNNPVPEHLIDVFQDGRTLREFNTHLLDGTKSLTGLIERPGCAGLDIDEVTKRLRLLSTHVWKYRPGLVCKDCQGHGCEKCGQRGWFTVMKVMGDRAAEASKQKREKGKSWRSRQTAREAPIPE